MSQHRSCSHERCEIIFGILVLLVHTTVFNTVDHNMALLGLTGIILRADLWIYVLVDYCNAFLAVERVMLC